MLAALCKTFSPSRLRTRIYNISFARRPLPGVSAPLWERGRAVVAPCPAPPCAGGGRARPKADAPSRSNAHFPRLRSRTCPPKTAPLPAYGRITVRKGGSAQGYPRPCPCVLPASARLRPSSCPLMGEAPCAKAEVHKAIPAAARACSPQQLVYGRAPASLWAKCRAQWRKCTRQSPPLPCVLPAAARLRPCTLPADGRSAERRVGEGEGKGGRPLAQQPAPVCLPPRPRRLNGHPASAGGRENDRMAHRRTATPRHRTPRGNDTCTIRVPRHKGAQSVVHNLYFSSSRPASFCTTFPQSCTDRPATYRKEHKSPPEGLIFRVLPPAFHPFAPKAIVQNTPAPPPFSPRKTPRFAPTRNRARTFASAGRDNTPRPAHSSRFQRDTNESAAHEMPIFAPPKAENGGVFGLKC